MTPLPWRTLQASPLMQPTIAQAPYGPSLGTQGYAQSVAPLGHLTSSSAAVPLSSAMLMTLRSARHVQHSHDVQSSQPQLPLPPSRGSSLTVPAAQPPYHEGSASAGARTPPPPVYIPSSSPSSASAMPAPLGAGRIVLSPALVATSSLAAPLAPERLVPAALPAAPAPEVDELGRARKTVPTTSTISPLCLAAQACSLEKSIGALEMPRYLQEALFDELLASGSEKYTRDVVPSRPQGDFHPQGPAEIVGDGGKVPGEWCEGSAVAHSQACRGWICDSCGLSNDAGAQRCRGRLCGSERPQAARKEPWKFEQLAPLGSGGADGLGSCISGVGGASSPPADSISTAPSTSLVPASTPTPVGGASSPPAASIATAPSTLLIPASMPPPEHRGWPAAQGDPDVLGAPPSPGGDWFSQVFGFRETESSEVRRWLVLEPSGDRRRPMLRSLANGRRFSVGEFQAPTLAELQRWTKDAATWFPGKLRVSNVVGDVTELHGLPENRLALFQVASRFNCLEVPGADARPEDGITMYAHHHSQGTACSVACAAGAAYRNYFVDVDVLSGGCSLGPSCRPGGLGEYGGSGPSRAGQASGRQLDCLRGICDALGLERDRLLAVASGHTLAEDHGLRQLGERLSALDAAALSRLRGALRVGALFNTSVTAVNWGRTPITDDAQMVTQAFTSGLTVAQSRNDPDLWAGLADVVLEAAYEATLRLAVLNAKRHNGTAASQRVYLTPLSGGLYGGPLSWTTQCLERALARLGNVDLDVRIVSLAPPDPLLACLEGEHPRPGVLRGEIHVPSASPSRSPAASCSPATSPSSSMLMAMGRSGDDLATSPVPGSPTAAPLAFSSHRGQVARGGSSTSPSGNGRGQAAEIIEIILEPGAALGFEAACDILTGRIGVSWIWPGTKAQGAGVALGDELIDVDRVPVAGDSAALARVLRRRPVELRFLRGGFRSAQLRMSPRPSPRNSPQPGVRRANPLLPGSNSSSLSLGAGGAQASSASPISSPMTEFRPMPYSRPLPTPSNISVGVPTSPSMGLLATSGSSANLPSRMATAAAATSPPSPNALRAADAAASAKSMLLGARPSSPLIDPSNNAGSSSVRSPSTGVSSGAMEAVRAEVEAARRAAEAAGEAAEAARRDAEALGATQREMMRRAEEETRALTEQLLEEQARVASLRAELEAARGVGGHVSEVSENDQAGPLTPLAAALSPNSQVPSIAAAAMAAQQSMAQTHPQPRRRTVSGTGSENLTVRDAWGPPDSAGPGRQCMPLCAGTRLSGGASIPLMLRTHRGVNRGSSSAHRCRTTGMPRDLANSHSTGSLSPPRSRKTPRPSGGFSALADGSLSERGHLSFSGEIHHERCGLRPEMRVEKRQSARGDDTSWNIGTPACGSSQFASGTRQRPCTSHSAMQRGASGSGSVAGKVSSSGKGDLAKHNLSCSAKHVGGLSEHRVADRVASLSPTRFLLPVGSGSGSSSLRGSAANARSLSPSRLSMSGAPISSRESRHLARAALREDGPDHTASFSTSSHDADASAGQAPSGGLGRAPQRLKVIWDGQVRYRLSPHMENKADASARPGDVLLGIESRIVRGVRWWRVLGKDPDRGGGGGKSPQRRWIPERGAGPEQRILEVLPPRGVALPSSKAQKMPYCSPRIRGATAAPRTPTQRSSDF